MALLTISRLLCTSIRESRRSTRRKMGFARGLFVDSVCLVQFQVTLKRTWEDGSNILISFATVGKKKKKKKIHVKRPIRRWS